MAERALAVDPASPEWQRISTALTRLREAVASGRTREDLRAAIRAVVAPLSAAARRGAAAIGEQPAADEALRSAWTGEARRR
jgi:hypothetical protein